MSKKQKKEKFVRNIEIVPKNQKQQNLFEAIKNYSMTVVIGPAGTGKSYVPVMLAAKALNKGRIDQIILTRPNKSSSERLGFDPGTELEKIEKWLIEPLKILKNALGKNEVECDIKNEVIRLVPFEKMRGQSWNDAFIICDEAQNITREEMEMFTTRLGNNTTIIVNGDVTQDDLKCKKTGLDSLIDLINMFNMNVPVIEFGFEDIVRSGLCAEFCINWHKYKQAE